MGIADGPDECRAAVREQIKRGADCIKVCATGGVTSLARDGTLPHYAQDELNTIVQTARDMGIDVTAHAHGDEGIRRAVEAGVVSIEHGTFMSEATMDAMIKHGTYFVRVRADGGEVCMTGGQWITSDAPAHDVRLSLSITTFNRQEYVRKTVHNVLQLESELAALTGRLRVFVVDNAQNVTFDAAPNAPLQVVPNGNLGGAGGFARGLMELRKQGWATHVLFMDDDITLEPEALVRTMALFAFARDPKLCVHGAMLSEERPWLQFEAGSEYSFRSIYPLQALGREDDLRTRELAITDAPEIPFDYTAWWYTAFPINITKDNPLPVFVRGDDVGFGLMHTGKHSITLNGVIVWHADFGLKNNPSSLYCEYCMVSH
jgi:GT2 family glycosyltransferase